MLRLSDCPQTAFHHDVADQIPVPVQCARQGLKICTIDGCLSARNWRSAIAIACAGITGMHQRPVPPVLTLRSTVDQPSPPCADAAFDWPATIRDLAAAEQYERNRTQSPWSPSRTGPTGRPTVPAEEPLGLGTTGLVIRASSGSDIGRPRDFRRPPPSRLTGRGARLVVAIGLAARWPGRRRMGKSSSSPKSGRNSAWVLGPNRADVAVTGVTPDLSAGGGPNVRSLTLWPSVHIPRH